MAEIIKQVPKFVILDDQEELKNQLLKIEIAGRTSYQSERNEGISLDTASNFDKMLIRRGHESVLEHSSTTVKFLDNSIGMMRELNRHRFASITEESTRYVDNKEMRFIFPLHKNENQRIDLDNGTSMTPVEMVEQMEIFYRGLRNYGWLAEEARSFLPLSLNSEEVVTANWREWRHIFELRTAKPAHFEIRSTMVEVLEEFQKVIPGVFSDFVPEGVDKNGYLYYKKNKI